MHASVSSTTYPIEASGQQGPKQDILATEYPVHHSHPKAPLGIKQQWAHMLTHLSWGLVFKG